MGVRMFIERKIREEDQCALEEQRRLTSAIASAAFVPSSLRSDVLIYARAPPRRARACPRARGPLPAPLPTQHQCKPGTFRPRGDRLRPGSPCATDSSACHHRRAASPARLAQRGLIATVKTIELGAMGCQAVSGFFWGCEYHMRFNRYDERCIWKLTGSRPVCLSAIGLGVPAMAAVVAAVGLGQRRTEQTTCIRKSLVFGSK
jgi:hypothetical protein